MCRLSTPGFGDSGNNPSQHENHTEDLVLGRVPDDDRQARRLGATFAAPAWNPILRDGVDDAPQVPAGYGQPDTRAAAG